MKRERRITSNNRSYQIVLPKKNIEVLGWQPGDMITFYQKGSGLYMKNRRRRR